VAHAVFAETHPETTIHNQPPSHDALSAPLDRVRETTGASHASALRYHADRSHLIVAAVSGLPFIAPGMELPVAPDGVFVGADEPPLVLSPIALLASAAGAEDTLAIALRPDDGRIEGFLYVAWTAAAQVPADRTALGTLNWSVPHISRALFDHDATPSRAVVAHEDHLIAGGVARQLERRRAIDAVTCSELGTLHRVLESVHVDLVLCSDSLAADLPLPALAATIRDRQPDGRLVLLTRTATPLSIGQAQSAPADGLVALDDGAPELLPVVDALARGDAALPPTPAMPDRGLSRRELQILRGLDEGLTYQEIAARAGVSLATIKTQSRPLFRKLEVTSRGAAVHQARKEGLL
jgi:DNA-binding NarL/FixJ family response regulator